MPASGRFSRFLYNSLLVGSTCYAMFNTPCYECPYGFAACVIGCSCGMLGLANAVLGQDNDDDCKKVKSLSRSMLEITPLPLVNIELYLHSQATSTVALGHGVFLLPLTLDFMCCVMRRSGLCHAADALKDLTVLGNIVSLTFLAVNEPNLLYGRMAVVCFLTKYSTKLFDCYNRDSGDEVLSLGSSCFFYLCASALRQFDVY